MPNRPLSTPVAFIIFNRPDTTERVFAEIARAKPPVLLVIADGPRADRPQEAERCAATRKVIEAIDWDCRLLTNYSDVNLGCKARVASGIDWVFEQVPEAIILEDDCLPQPTFFRFCEELLERFRDDERIAHIGGTNFQFGRRCTDASYYFSRYSHIWGWASWRRAWRHYRVDIPFWPRMRDEGWLDGLIGDRAERAHWQRTFERVFRGEIDTWDYQWMLSSWAQGMLTVIPESNLISNIGFGDGATHTTGASPYSDMPTRPMDFPIVHPEIVLPNRSADAFTSRSMFSTSFGNRLRRKFGLLKA